MPCPRTPSRPQPLPQARPGTTKRNRKKMAALDCEEPERELKRSSGRRASSMDTRRLRLGPWCCRWAAWRAARPDPDWQELQIVGTCLDITSTTLASPVLLTHPQCALCGECPA